MLLRESHYRMDSSSRLISTRCGLGIFITGQIAQEGKSQHRTGSSRSLVPTRWGKGKLNTGQIPQKGGYLQDVVKGKSLQDR